MSWRFGTQEEIINTVESSGNSGSLDTKGHGCLSFTGNVTAISGSGASIQFDLEASDDAVSWNQVHSTRQITAVGNQRLSGVRITARYYRYRWTVLGTTPSISFTLTSTLKDYLPVRTGSQFRYGDLDLKTTNAVSSAYSSFSNTEISISAIRGNDSLTAATIIIEASLDSTNWHTESGNIQILPGQAINSTISGNAYRFYRLKTITPAVGVGAILADVLYTSTGGA